MIDVQELPLNASRELLQQSSLIKKLNKTLVKKTIEMIEDLTSNEEDYAKFYENFGRFIKLGVHEDSNNRPKLLELLRFYSSKSLDKMTSLKSYVERMHENQAGIYFITGNTLNNVKSSPFIDKLLKQDIEVIYMTEPIDEYNMTQVHEYSQKKFINAIKDDLKLDDSNETDTSNNDEICKTIKEKLGDKVESVIVSKKLSSQPAVMSNKYGVSANMERIMKSQVVRDGNNMQNFGSNSKVLEINPEHQVIKNLVNKSYDENYLGLVYHLALIAGGYELENNNEFLSNVYQYI
jgi:molecular chaperone HtpG